jgi:ABC-2 type transport system permease protein
MSAFLTSLNLAVDLARPLLDWISPQKAMKQNLNVLIAMLLDLGFLFLYGLAFVALGKSPLSLMAVIGVLLALGAGLAGLAWVLLLRFALRRYPSIDA